MVIVFVEMCGRFSLKSPGRIKFDRVDRSNVPPLFPRYNIAPSQNVLAVVQQNGEREATFLQWGYIPSWSKDAKRFINARSETIEDKPSFSESFQKRRCLIPADGFYEWQRSGKIAQPYFFHMRDESPFAFAGLWDEWQSDGKVIASCAIITTTANELLASIHDLMPVILPPESQDKWLDDESEPAALRSLLSPFPASAMVSHAVSYDVTIRRSIMNPLLRLSNRTLELRPVCSRCSRQPRRVIRHRSETSADGPCGPEDTAASFLPIGRHTE